MLSHEQMQNVIQKRLEDSLDRDETLIYLKATFGFSDDEAADVYKDIRSLEMDMDVASSQQSILSKVTNHVGFSYFFLLFALIASGYSLYLLFFNPQEDFNKVMPWVVLLGCAFLFIKHGQRVFGKNEPK